VLDLAWRGQAGPAADGLGEAHPAIALLRIPAQSGQQRVLERVPQGAQPDGGVPDQAATAVAAAIDLAPRADLDPAAQEVGEPEFVTRPQRLEVVDLIRRRIVVVGESTVEGHPGTAGHSFGRDPGQ